MTRTMCSDNRGVRKIEVRIIEVGLYMYMYIDTLSAGDLAKPNNSYDWSGSWHGNVAKADSFSTEFE